VLVDHEELSIFPAKHFVTDKEKVQAALTDIEKELEEQVKYFEEQGKLVEAQRLDQRTRFDMEMIREIGYVSGIENYSRHLDRRPPGSPPWTLIDFFPADFLLVLDESHMTVPQIRGMYAGDQSRKRTLVEHGFRLPSAMDNRPLNFDEFLERTGQTLYTSATPADYEQDIADQIVQQVIRPTGVLDPIVEVRPTEGQIDDLIHEVSQRVKRGQRALVTTLTKRMAEDLTEYLREMEINVNYLHSEVDTLERVEILRDLRMGVYDVIIGVNLLREGLDLPEVSLIGILDADKEGFLRSETALVQTIGRAARHVEGTVIMYADKMTDSMRGAIDETARRREIQQAYNEAHGIEPASIVKEVKDLTQRVRQMAESDREMRGEPSPADLPRADLDKLIRELERQMKDAAQRLEFEKAAVLRDQIIELRQVMAMKVATDADEAPLWQRDLVGASEVEED
jgi:excinuclease ABC subunit B